jgi:hypothetical protein
LGSSAAEDIRDKKMTSENMPNSISNPTINDKNSLTQKKSGK